MAASLGRGSSAPALVVSLPTARVSPAVSPAASPERSRPTFVHHDLRHTGRARHQITAGPPSPDPSLSSLLRICGAEDRLGAFVAEGFVTAGEVKAAALTEADLERLGLRMKARKQLLQLIAQPIAPPVQLIYRGDLHTGPGDGSFDVLKGALRKIVVDELGLQVEKAAVTTAQQIAASTGAIKDQMNILIRDEVLLLRDEMSSLRSTVAVAHQQTQSTVAEALAEAHQQTQSTVAEAHQQTQSTVAEALAEAHQQTLGMLVTLLENSQRLADIGHQSFETLRSMAQGDAEVPRLMTITALDSAVWKGAWYENTESNIASWLKSKAGISCSFRLHFLCAFHVCAGRSVVFCCSASLADLENVF
eukprot:COSAG05_NODE_2329_length_3229_cov_14.334185_2_plen_363_part_00